MADEEGVGDVKDLPVPGRLNANTFLEMIHAQLREKTWIDLCLADCDDSFADLKNAHDPFIHLNVLEWGGLVHPVHDGSWVYMGEKVHPRFEAIGAVVNTAEIDTSQVRFLRDLKVRVKAMLVGSRIRFMEEVAETIPVLFTYIYRMEVPDRNDIEEICIDRFEVEQMSPSTDPVKLIMDVIAHELNAHLWRVDK